MKQLVLHKDTVTQLDQDQADLRVEGAEKHGNMLTSSSCFPHCTCNPGLDRN